MLYSCGNAQQENIQYFKGEIVVPGEGRGSVYMALSTNAGVVQCMVAVVSYMGYKRDNVPAIEFWDVQPVVKVGRTGTASVRTRGWGNDMRLFWNNDGSIRVLFSSGYGGWITLKAVSKNEFEEVIELLEQQ